MSLRTVALQKLVDNIAQEVVDSVNDVLATEANKMVREMRTNVAKQSGTLMGTIHAERISGRSSIGVRIRAGGLATTKPVRSGSGIAYDYSRAIEFGTHHAGAQPFFFSTFRARKAGAKEKVKAGVKQAMQKAVSEARR